MNVERSRLRSRWGAILRARLAFKVECSKLNVERSLLEPTLPPSPAHFLTCARFTYYALPRAAVEQRRRVRGLVPGGAALSETACYDR